MDVYHSPNPAYPCQVADIGRGRKPSIADGCCSLEAVIAPLPVDKVLKRQTLELFDVQKYQERGGYILEHAK